ncbi:MAG: hypothetical protein MJK18_08850 [Bdellovibrionales bacterium]|nr:hypothetical protein [Bdellovibrionales bacterium]
MIRKTVSMLFVITMSLLVAAASKAGIPQVPMAMENGELKLDTAIVDWIDGYPIIEVKEGGHSVIIEQNDAGEGLIISLEEYMENKGENFLNFVANYFNFKKTFQTVTSYVTREMEQRFQTFIIVNVDYRNLEYGSQKIPSQHMRILRKGLGTNSVFIRDENGQITGFRADALGMGTSEQPAMPAYAWQQTKIARFAG